MAPPSKRLHNLQLTALTLRKYNETNPIVFISLFIAPDIIIIMIDCEMIKPMQPHLVAQTFARWQHSNIFFEIKESKITRGHNYTLVKIQSRLDVRKYSFSQRTINVWNNLPTDCV